MADIALKQLRIQNLKEVLESARFEGNASAMAREWGVQPSYINDVIKGTKSFGEKAARKAEQKLRLPAGSLDLNRLDSILEAEKWPFTSFDEARFVSLTPADKLRVEGAALGALIEIELRQNAENRKKQR